MRCRICRQATLPGARLCGPCRAALKRARHGGDAGDGGPEGGAAVSRDIRADFRIADDPERGPRSAVRSRRLRRWPAVVMMASVLGAAAWILPRSHPEAPETRAVPVASRTIVAPPATIAAVPPAADIAAPPAADTAAPPAGDTAVPPAADTAAPRERAPIHRAVRRAAADRGDARRPPAQQASVASVASVAAVAAASVTAASGAPAAEPPPATALVKQTRWQAMDDAMAACSGGFFDRLLCRQRARIAFCNGYWGRVGECATSAATDATR